MSMTTSRQVAPDQGEEVAAFGAQFDAGADLGAVLDELRTQFAAVSVRTPTANAPGLLTCREAYAPIARRRLLRLARLLYVAGASEVAVLGETERVLPRLITAS